MDPNTTLERLRVLDKQQLENGPPHSASCGCDYCTRNRADEMAVLFQDLDDWLSKAGALPDGWQREGCAS